MRRALAAGLLLLASCGGESPTSPAALAVTAAPTASAVLAVSVEVAAVKKTGDSRAPMRADWRVVIRETSGGVGLKLTWVNTTLRDAASGARATPTGTAYLSAESLAALLGSERLAAGGSASVPGGLQYKLPSGGAVGLLSVAVQALDDNGHTLTALAEAEVR